MNAIVPSRLDGEILLPADTVRVVGKAHPLNGGRIDCRLPAGLTISEMLCEALADRPALAGRGDFVVHIDGHVIEPRNWRRVRVKKGATLTFTPRLAGGNILRSVLTLAVAVAALTFGGPIAGLLGFTGVALTVATAVVSTTIVLAGTLAINALFPVRPQAQSTTQSPATLNSIQGAQNQANPFGPVPVVLGRHRQSPYYAAKPYTEIIGDDQYLRLLFCMGYGPMDLSDFKIGEAGLSTFADYAIEVRQGFPSDLPPTLYPAQVDELALQVALDPSVWNEQTSSVDTDEISVDFTAVNGVVELNSEGNSVPRTVVIATRYALIDAVSWTDGPSATFTQNYDPMRRGVRITVARGQYRISVSRRTAAGDPAKVKDDIVWTAMRSVKNAAALTFPKPLALVALRIRATDQLSGIINTFNGVCASLVKSYSGSGSTWIDDTASNNCADLFRHVLQGPANARPEPDGRIDIQNLQEWWIYCRDNGFAFNQVINSVGSVYDKLCDIAAAGRAVPTFIDGKWGVIWDRPNDSIVQHFTPRNSWGFQGQKPYAQKPHGWRVTFINEDNGYTSDERIVYDDGYDETNATLFEGIQFPGVTDPDLIWKHGRFHIAQSRLRPEKFSLNVGWEHLVCTRGDRVRVTHDVLLIGLGQGRVKSVAGQVVTFDEVLTIEDGKTYAIQFRVAADARVIDRSVDVTAAGETTSLTLVGDLSGVAAGDLFGFGETDRASANYRVQGISHKKDLIATLTLVDDAPETSQADQGEIPEYDPHITIPADPFTLPPRDLRYLEVIDRQGAVVRALVRLTWQVPRLAGIASYQVQRRNDDAGGDFETVASVLPPATSVDVPYTSAGVWSFRVRCIFSDGTASNWVSLIALNLQALSAPPDDIVNLHQHSVDGQTVIDWNAVQDQRIIAYEVRKGTSWDTGLVVGDSVAQPPWATTGDGTYHVRAYVQSPFGARIYSVATASIAIADSIISRNIILSRDEQATGWTGGLNGGVIDGSFIRTDIGKVIDTPWAQEVVDQLALEGLHIAIYVSGTIVDIGRAAECRFWTEFEASGVLQSEDFLAHTDVLASQDILGTAPTRFIRAFPIWRFASEGENDVFGPTDVFAPADVFAGNVTWLDWIAIASGTRVARYFVPGYVLITDREDTDATGTKFSWFVDVPDRTDDYTDLNVPDTGLDITFYSGGYNAVPVPGATAVPFNGGPNGSTVPHVQRAIVDGVNGDEVKVTNLTAAGCTVHVVNAGVNVTRAGVNLLVRGY
ncbi:tail fiber protein [Bradyrhizobium japonicum]|uniref:Tail fiber protein n=1 Tax=Bradyrhizobium japonicum TaxID=375 RepID=A0A0A3YQ20_BRAJP|nr:host specificity factor TipJ family phage tail protein [Bradyrhizobium japonicum]KGT75788.1 tail fiber protein [Bradyrhizobium japonicum]